ncbi:hypothetical protein E2C01_084717 [Portunus trituberculatus]|uniref:Secreted protein n=1 Tax=Portunus trituberculatus TaxID=210409 RepID=A0A5B7JA09_PORTR|nr:hypothetical protein [Portunus trituberculatus]
MAALVVVVAAAVVVAMVVAVCVCVCVSNICFTTTHHHVHGHVHRGASPPQSSLSSPRRVLEHHKTISMKTSRQEIRKFETRYG